MNRYIKALAACSLVQCVKSSPLWFITPAAVLLVGMGSVVAGYQPLVFDESLYQAEKANAAEVDELDAKVDAKKLEAEKAAKEAARAKSETLSASSLAKKAVAANAELADGDYLGYARCAEDDIFDYYLKLTVTVKNGKVASITQVGGSASGNSGDKKLAAYETVNDPYILWAAQGRTVGSKTFTGVVPQIMTQVKAGRTVSDIDTVSGATYSSRSILVAYYDALGKSAKAGGVKVVKPKAVKKAQAGNQDALGEDVASGSDATIPIVPDGTGDGAGDASSSTQAASYGSGTFTSYALCQDTKDTDAYSPYYIGVTITTLDGKVLGITDIFGDAQGVVDPHYLYSAAENKYYLDRAINGYGISGKHPGIKKQVETLLAAGEVDGTFDTISGATYSSRSIVEAYRLCLKDAAASAEVVSQEPDSLMDPQTTYAEVVSQG